MIKVRNSLAGQQSGNISSLRSNVQSLRIIFESSTTGHRDATSRPNCRVMSFVRKITVIFPQIKSDGRSSNDCPCAEYLLEMLHGFVPHGGTISPSRWPELHLAQLAMSSFPTCVDPARVIFSWKAHDPTTHVEMDTTTTTTPPRSLRDNKRRCPLCSRTFSKTEHLERHIRSHTKEKPFECQHCGRKYGRKYVPDPMSNLFFLTMQ